jgi:hypothetical protein
MSFILPCRNFVPTAQKSSLPRFQIRALPKFWRRVFLKPMGLSQCRLAKDIGVPVRRINEIVKGERAFTADTA